jgi:hypothetical protein
LCNEEGDRLGHALALGVDAESWLARHGDALLPVDEHVDNLVWAWHEADVLAERLPWCAKVKDHLEKRIAACCLMCRGCIRCALHGKTR